MIDLIQQAARDGARPPDLSKSVIEWGAENVVNDDTSNWKGQLWKPELTPYVHDPMLDYVNDDIQALTVMAGSQVAKTAPFLICLAWTIINDPSPTLWVSSTEPVLKIFAKARMWPTLQRCKPVADILGDMPKGDQGIFHIYFPGMLLSLTSSEANAELQSTPYRRIILDEARKYRPENFNMVQKRTRTFTWNKMQVILSCPEEEKDHVHQAYLNGDQREWEFECKGCRRRQRLFFRKKNEMGDIIGGLLYTTDKKTKPGPEYDMNELMKTVRYKCIYCDCSYVDEPEIRWWILNAKKHGAGWKAMNPLAVSTHRSYHWNALLPIWVTWGSIVEEFINAMKALRFGDIDRLKEFTVETLGEPFEARDRYEVSDQETPTGKYKLGDQWTEEECRFMTIDVHPNWFWVVIRAWSLQGDSRLLYEGGGLPEDAANGDPAKWSEKPITTWDQLRALQLDYRVQVNWVAIDVAHFQTKIIRQICLYYDEFLDSTWLAFQGTNQRDFIHLLPDGRRARRIYSSESLLDAWIGTQDEGNPEYHPVPFYLFSDEAAQDRLENERRSGRWTIAMDAQQRYRQQLDGEAKIEVIDKKTGERSYKYTLVGNKGNHLRDCEKNQIVLASMMRIIGVERVERDNELSSRKEKQDDATSQTVEYTLRG